MITEHVVSRDGTRIAFERTGDGPPVILVGGAFNDATTVAALAGVLAPSFAPIGYDRRGRGKSTDERAPAGDRVAAEVADLAALVEHIGEPACVFGHSSGGILAMEAAIRGVPFAKIAVYEPPYVVENVRPRPREDLLDRTVELLANGDRDGAAALFLTESAGVPAPGVEQMKGSPMWPWFTGLAESLPYDIAVSGPGNILPADRLAALGVPVLVLAGGNTEPWLAAASRAVAAAIPHAEHRTVAGQDHGVLHQPEALRGPLAEFFGPGR
jgi:pimeloyl-ACP methyl ester carboxylesterase